jgi:uracil-DNA glycosylase
MHPILTGRLLPFPTLETLQPMDIRTSQDYEAQLRACTKCAGLLADKRVDPLTSNESVKPRPIVLALDPKPIMLVGQAPGLKEYQSGEPFCGPAGKSIRMLFAACGVGEADFKRLVHTSAIAKCYPGSKVRSKADRSRREDLKPSSAMIANCSPFAMAQLKIVDPRVIVLLGKLPLQAYLQWITGATRDLQLKDWVGRIEEWQGRRVIALAHTSGLATWLNKPVNKALQEKAKKLLRSEVQAIRRAAGR